MTVIRLTAAYALPQKLFLTLKSPEQSCSMNFFPLYLFVSLQDVSYSLAVLSIPHSQCSFSLSDLEIKLPEKSCFCFPGLLPEEAAADNFSKLWSYWTSIFACTVSMNEAAKFWPETDQINTTHRTNVQVQRSSSVKNIFRVLILRGIYKHQ